MFAYRDFVSRGASFWSALGLAALVAVAQGALGVAYVLYRYCRRVRRALTKPATPPKFNFLDLVAIVALVLVSFVPIVLYSISRGLWRAVLRKDDPDQTGTPPPTKRRMIFGLVADPSPDETFGRLVSSGALLGFFLLIPSTSHIWSTIVTSPWSGVAALGVVGSTVGAFAGAVSRAYRVPAFQLFGFSLLGQMSAYFCYRYDWWLVRSYGRWWVLVTTALLALAILADILATVGPFRKRGVRILVSQVFGLADLCCLLASVASLSILVGQLGHSFGGQIGLGIGEIAGAALAFPVVYLLMHWISVKREVPRQTLSIRGLIPWVYSLLLLVVANAGICWLLLSDAPAGVEVYRIGLKDLKDSQARVQDLGEKIRQTAVLKMATTEVPMRASSPDGTYAISANIDGTLSLSDQKDGKTVRRFEGHRGFVNSVAFSSDGRRILSSGDDGTIRLWDVNSGRQLCVCRVGDATVQKAQFFEDDRHALSVDTKLDGTFRQTVRIWELPD